VVQPAALGVLLQPAAQPRPLAQQRLVGDLASLAADVTSRPSASASSPRPARLELGQRQRRRTRALLADRPRAARDRARCGARPRRAAVDALGQPRDRACDAAGAS
jgi:hypothetical protein